MKVDHFLDLAELSELPKGVESIEVKWADMRFFKHKSFIWGYSTYSEPIELITVYKVEHLPNDVLEQLEDLPVKLSKPKIDRDLIKAEIIKYFGSLQNAEEYFNTKLQRSNEHIARLNQCDDRDTVGGWVWDASVNHHSISSMISAFRANVINVLKKDNEFYLKMLNEIELLSDGNEETD